VEKSQHVCPIEFETLVAHSCLESRPRKSTHMSSFQDVRPPNCTFPNIAAVSSYRQRNINATSVQSSTPFLVTQLLSPTFCLI
jgi:hypothetical protein